MGIAPMTRTLQEVIDRVKRQFGDESGVQITDTDIIAWTNQAVVDIVKANRNLKAVGTTPIIPGQDSYTFPSIRILVIEVLQCDGVPLKYLSFNEAQEFIASYDPNKVNTGIPEVWYEFAETIHLYPVPSSAVSTLTIFYVQYPSTLIAGIDVLPVPDNYFTTVLSYCLQQAHQLDDNWTAAEVMQKQVQDDLAVNSDDSDGVESGEYKTITILAEDAYY